MKTTMVLLLLTASVWPQPAPVIRSTTRLVQINVVVHDKKGNPVTDLTKDDFVLTDKGQEQQIRFFAVEMDKPVSAAKPLPPLAEGVFSNRLTAPDPEREAPPNLTVILLDGLNTQFTDQHFMRKAALHVLANMHAGDPVALYALKNGLQVLHDFTSQPPELLEALKKLQSENFQALAESTPNTDIIPPSQPGIGRAQGDPVIGEMLSNLDEATQLFYIKHRVETTVAAFETIVYHLQGLPGRKNLIWISGSFPFSFGLTGSGTSNNYESFAGQVDRVVREFNRAAIAVYPVDARGLMGMFARYPIFAASSQGAGPGRLNTATRDMITSTQALMLDLAKRTGGKAFLETNDMAGALQEAMDDARVTYMLAFSPSHDQWNGEFREVKVHVKRPGLDVRYRPGYLALPDPSNDVKMRQNGVVAAGNIALISTGLSLQAGLDKASAPGTLKLGITLDANELSFIATEKGEPMAVVDLLVVLRAADGKAISSITRTLRRAQPEAGSTAAQGSGIHLTLDVPQVAGAVRARLVARDANTGLVGSVDVPIN